MASLSKWAWLCVCAGALFWTSDCADSQSYSIIEEKLPTAPAFDGCFYPPTGFDPETATAIEADATKWNAVTDLNHRLTFSTACHQRIISWVPSEPGYAGQWAAEHGIIFIRPGVAHIPEYTLHELGHALGLGHIPVPGAVMCSDELGVPCPDPPVSEITAADVIECRRVGACS